MVFLLLIGIAVLSVMLLVTIGFSLYFFGIFERIEVKSGPSPYRYGKKRVVVKVGKGSWADSSAIFTEVNSILVKRTTLAIYFEPRHIKEDVDSSLYSKLEQDEYIFIVGAVIENDPGKEEMDLLKDKGFHVVDLPEDVDNVIHCQFPYRGVVSAVVATRRVYQQIERYIEEHRLCAYPKIEVYQGDVIHYLLPLSHQKEFVTLLKDELILWAKETKLYLEVGENLEVEDEEGETTEQDDSDESDYEIVHEEDEEEEDAN